MSTLPQSSSMPPEGKPAWRHRVEELARPALLPSPPAPWLAYEVTGILLVPLIIIAFVWWDRAVILWVRTLTESEREWAQVLSHLAHGNLLIPTMSILLLLGLWRGWKRLWRWTAIAAMGYATSSLAVNVLKVVFGRHRPNALFNDDYGFEFFAFGYDVNSFPSGHSAAIGSLLGLVILLKPRFAPLWIVIALAWASARIFSHSHYPGDVLAGLYVGTGCTFLAYSISRRKAWWNRQFAVGA